MEGPPARGSGLYPLRRQISAARQVRLLYPLPIFCAGSSTDQNSWPTPNRCGFNSRTAHHSRISSKVEPAVDNCEVLVRFQHPAPMFVRVTGRDGRCTRLLSETRLVRFQRHPPDSRDWQIWICTRLLSETKWVRFPHPAPESLSNEAAHHNGTMRRASTSDDESQISLPLPTWGCGPTD